MNKIYLGDSVYAEIEHRGIAGEAMIKLTTNNGYPDDPRNVIYLDKLTYDALIHWVAHFNKEQKEGRK